MLKCAAHCMCRMSVVDQQWYHGVACTPRTCGLEWWVHIHHCQVTCQPAGLPVTSQGEVLVKARACCGRFTTGHIVCFKHMVMLITARADFMAHIHDAGPEGLQCFEVPTVKRSQAGNTHTSPAIASCP